MSEFINCLMELQQNIYKPQEQACIPVFRVLPLPCRTILARMLYSDSFTSDMLAAQCSANIDKAIQLRIIARNKDKSVTIEPNFAASLREVIEGRSIPILKKAGETSSSKDQLKEECCDKWKHLFDLISKRNPKQVQNFRPRVKQILIESHLLRENSGVGFQFILSSTHKQINQILKYYVAHQPADTIRFILALSVLDPLSIYAMPTNPQEEEIISDLAELGFTQKIGHQVRITYLLWNFLYEEPAVSIDIHCNIIVEANFRIYAYLETKDEIEEEILCNLLSLFSEIKKKFPNLIIADLTEESIRRACNKNLKAMQIIQFLEMNNKRFSATNEKPNVGEDLKKRLSFLRVFQEGNSEKTLIPHNVVQQIKFWEEQRNK